MAESYTAIADCGMRILEERPAAHGVALPIRNPQSALGSSPCPSKPSPGRPPAVRIIDQRALPEAEITRDLESAESVADAIRQLQVRGAPLIGIAAAMGVVTGLREQRAASRGEFLTRLQESAGMLVTTRPTAVNLRWA